MASSPVESPPPPDSPPSSSSPPSTTPTTPTSSPSPPPTTPASSPPPTLSPPPLDASPPPPDASPPPKTPPPAPPTQSSPPPNKASPTPSPPQDSDSSPPPPSPNASSPPPPSNDNSTPPPPPPLPSPGSSNHVPPPPPQHFSPPPPSSGSLSPPHAPTHRTPPPPHTPSHTPSHHDSLSTQTLPLIIGVAAGVGLLLVVMIVFFLSCTKKKKKRPHDQMQYYMDTSGGSKGVSSEYYNSSQHRNWHNSPQSIPPPPGAMGSAHGGLQSIPPPPGAMGSAHGGWPTPPPPPPPIMMSSSEMSSNYSGPHQPPLPPPHPAIALGFNKSTFTYDELAAATGGFSHANVLGQGGFGYVHKGVLPNGKDIAVKSLKSGSGQGEREFQAEVEIISRVHHRHLVSLAGYCIAGAQRILVYEFVPNNNLEYHLHGKGRPTMDWSTRLRIALGSAKGLAYLHEDCHPRIIHRDIKTANILIDYNFDAKVADFGLAKLSSDTNTHVSTRIMGTFGYLAPEYASSGKLTEKSDVFSFGVMLLELITGRRPVDTTGEYMEDSLVDWARPIILHAMEDGNYGELIDPRLENNYSSQEMACMVACASACVRHSARRRPKMSQVVRALEGDVSLDDLNEGVKPGQSSFFGSNGSSDYDAGTYNAEMKKFRKMALMSQEYGSSEYGATSEYGLNPSSSSSDSQETGKIGSRRQSP